MKVIELVEFLDAFAPPGLQESYDNAGLLLGDPGATLSGALISVDVTEKVIMEAVKKKMNLVVAHHPLIFQPLKKITGSGPVEKAVIASLREGVAVYAAHTNLDAVHGGVNGRICRKIGLQNCSVLKPERGRLKKLVCFIPSGHLESVSRAVFDAGAGHIGNYDRCGYHTKGEGTFRALDGADPYVGKTGEIHTEPEVRWETVFPFFLQSRVVKAMIDAHPYEEVAYDIYPLENEWPGAGQGMTGSLEKEMTEKDFLKFLKDVFHIPCIRHSPLRGKKVKKVAVCGGSGSHLTEHAIGTGADAFLTADISYHRFFDADGKILLADIGHYESEQFTKEIFYELISKKFPNFAVQFSETNTNPVNYL
ncbi:MAG TPA: Nif3-like dinuclear metal center hexameric protein [Bacteroidetes bacterium]|nr:Nif3-like dinuclear metal center hexameric protein [Bacteroidota bacterium]